jgi:hypothetical protein
MLRKQSRCSMIFAGKRLSPAMTSRHTKRIWRSTPAAATLRRLMSGCTTRFGRPPLVQEPLKLMKCT